MKLVLRLLLSTIAVLVTDLLLSGVELGEFPAALWVAIVLGLLNTVVRPLLILLTLPVTLFTMGLFILVINAAMVMLADHFIDGFHVRSFWWALLFSIVMWVVQGFLNSLDGGQKQQEEQ